MTEYNRYSDSLIELISKLYCSLSESDPLSDLDRTDSIEKEQLYSTFMQLMCNLEMSDGLGRM